MTGGAVGWPIMVPSLIRPAIHKILLFSMDTNVDIYRVKVGLMTVLSLLSNSTVYEKALYSISICRGFAKVCG